MASRSNTYFVFRVPGFGLAYSSHGAGRHDSEESLQDERAWAVAAGDNSAICVGVPLLLSGVNGFSAMDQL